MGVGAKRHPILLTVLPPTGMGDWEGALMEMHQGERFIEQLFTVSHWMERFAEKLEKQNELQMERNEILEKANGYHGKLIEIQTEFLELQKENQTVNKNQLFESINAKLELAEVFTQEIQYHLKFVHETEQRRAGLLKEIKELRETLEAQANAEVTE